MKTLFKRILFLISVLVLTVLFSLAVPPNHHAAPVSLYYSYAQSVLPNLRFGSINIHSQEGTYDIIAFKDYDYSISLFAENSGIKNVRVIAGIVDGNVFYDKTFSYVSDATHKRIEFTYAMPIGTHTMFIEVDPENIMAEQNESDNRVTRTFIADLRINVR
ncbi:MAG: hypothetical protein MUP22_05270 [Desulfobacterales bacterium]|nr:hypothetical protein [Desulfobacterales bacterium]